MPSSQSLGTLVGFELWSRLERNTSVGSYLRGQVWLKQCRCSSVSAASRASTTRLDLLVRPLIRPPMLPVRQPVVLIHTVRAPDHDTLVPIEIVNLAVNSKEDVRKCFLIENFPAAVFSFHIGWDALGPGFMVAVDTEEFDRNGAGIPFARVSRSFRVIISEPASPRMIMVSDFVVSIARQKVSTRRKFPCVSPVR